MKKIIDCLIIGHNEMNFSAYEETVRSMGMESGSYRDLNLNFIQYKGSVYSMPEIFNMFHFGNESLDNSAGPFSLGNVFSATIAYLGTYLHRRGLSFDYINSFRNESEQLADILQNSEITLVVIPTTLYVSAFPILEIISYVKKYNDRVKIVVGGPFISTQCRVQDEADLQYLFKTLGADFYINNSQGESALVNIIHALKNRSSLENVENISYKFDGRYFTTHNSLENNRLEENTVDWSLFSDRLNNSAAVRTAISCPFSCSFCGFPQHAGKYQTMPVEVIERELNTLKKVGKVKSINFIDDTLNVPPERFKDILRMMIRNKYDFNWNCYFRCQFADREMVELMKESGCQGTFLGFESASPQILRNMNKSATVDKYKEGLGLLKEFGIITYGSFIIGFPGETLETVQDTVRFIEENQPDFFRTQAWYCDPFTPIWNEREKYGVKNSQYEWSHSKMNSNTAFNLIDEIYLSIKNSIWVPQYNFEFIGIFNLLNRGLSLEQIKNLINGFNEGIKQKLRNPANREVSPQIVQKITNIYKTCQDTKCKDETKILDKYDADFDF